MLMKLRGMMTHPEGQKGFTLVELIVVMAILAVLAALAVPRFANILSDSKTKANAANIQMISKAAEMYIANESAEKVTAFQAYYKDSGAEIAAGSELLNGYLKEVPKDPVTGNSYTLTVGESPDYKVSVKVTP